MKRRRRLETELSKLNIPVPAATIAKLRSGAPLIKPELYNLVTLKALSLMELSNVSEIEDMSYLFYGLNCCEEINISKWDVSNVKDMGSMFHKSQFNGDISIWDVSSVKDMGAVFHSSQFNGDISKWEVSNVKGMVSMFYNSRFNGDISMWDVSSVKNMWDMFKESKFTGSIEQWVINPSILGDCGLPSNRIKLNSEGVQTWKLLNL